LADLLIFSIADYNRGYDDAAARKGIPGLAFGLVALAFSPSFGFGWMGTGVLDVGE
jgi:hypothetical protein